MRRAMLEVARWAACLLFLACFWFMLAVLQAIADGY